MKGKFNVNKFEEALLQVINTHDVLKSKIIFQNNHYHLQTLNQTFKSTSNFLTQLKLPTTLIVSSTPTVEKIRETIRECGDENFFSEFNLTNNWLWRAALIEIEPQHYQVCFLFHHLIVNNASIEIFINDLSYFYNSHNNHLHKIELIETNNILALNPKIEKKDKINLSGM